MKLPTMPKIKNTSLFIALLVLGLASFFLWYGKLDGTVWAGIAGYILTVYVVRRVKLDERAKNGGPIVTSGRVRVPKGWADNMEETVKDNTK